MVYVCFSTLLAPKELDFIKSKKLGSWTLVMLTSVVEKYHVIQIRMLASILHTYIVP